MRNITPVQLLNVSFTALHSLRVGIPDVCPSAVRAVESLVVLVDQAAYQIKERAAIASVSLAK